ncbi:MAG: helicase-related protein, partial [Pseudolabrys sp.]
VWIANYDILDRFDPAGFGGVSLDESSILKSFTGATTRELIRKFSGVPFRLEASATPAPNDYTEIGQHSEFLGVMRSAEMLSRFFINDSNSAGKYRLKRPAIIPFWDWVASWSRCARLPSDLGYADDGYALPPLNVIDHTVAADRSLDVGIEKSGQIPLFRLPENSATSIHREKRLTLSARSDLSAEVVSSDGDQPWIVWVETDAEEEAMSARLPDFVTVRGSQPPLAKEKRLLAFSRGDVPGIITKPSIAGFGLNWQHCARQIFVGLSFSFEMYYQAIRRSWRFGQQYPVQIHVVGSDTERSIRAVIARKEADHNAMQVQMRAAMRRASASMAAIATYLPNHQARVPLWLN